MNIELDEIVFYDVTDKVMEASSVNAQQGTAISSYPCALINGSGITKSITRR